MEDYYLAADVLARVRQGKEQVHPAAPAEPDPMRKSANIKPKCVMAAFAIQMKLAVKMQVLTAGDSHET